MATKQLSQKSIDYVQEYMLCKSNFNYFCETYVWLELPGKDVKFKPYRRQKELIQTVTEHNYVLVLKSRQIGISTVIQVYAAWLAIFYDNCVIGIISKDGAESTVFARTIRGIIDKLPKWMKPKGGNPGDPGFAKRSEQSFILTNGSKCYASPVAPQAPEKTHRGKSITFLVIDEAAFIGNLDEAWTSMVPALATNQMHAREQNVPFGTVILSTPNKTTGKGKWFFDKYTASINKDDIFKPFTIHWKSIPELCGDPLWYKNQCALFGNDPKKIAQELELKFLPSSGSFFTDEISQLLQDIEIEPIEITKLFNGEIWEFVVPQPNTYYIMGVDTASEFGLDKSTIQIFNYQTMEQVCEYSGKCAVLDFIKVIEYLGFRFPGIIVVENNSYGNQVIETLGRSDLASNIYKEKRSEKLQVPGVSTNANSRPLMIDALYTFVNDFPQMIKSKRYILELLSLVEKASGKVEADSGCHDDLVMAAAFCYYVKKWDPPLAITMQQGEVMANMRDIMGMNDANDFTDGFGNIQQSFLLKHVKEKLFEKQVTGGSFGESYVDILDFYTD